MNVVIEDDLVWVRDGCRGTGLPFALLVDEGARLCDDAYLWAYEEHMASFAEAIGLEPQAQYYDPEDAPRAPFGLAAGVAYATTLEAAAEYLRIVCVAGREAAQTKLRDLLGL